MSGETLNATGVDVSTGSPPYATPLGDGCVLLRFGNMAGEERDVKILTESVHINNAVVDVVRLGTCKEAVRQIRGDKLLPLSCIELRSHRMQPLPVQIEISDLPSLVIDGHQAGGDVGSPVDTADDCDAPSVHFKYIIKLMPPSGVDLVAALRAYDLPVLEHWLYYAAINDVTVELVESVVQAAWLEIVGESAAANVDILKVIVGVPTTPDSDKVAFSTHDEGWLENMVGIQEALDLLNELEPPIMYDSSAESLLSTHWTCGDPRGKRALARIVLENATWSWWANLKKFIRDVEPPALLGKLMHSNVTSPNIMGLTGWGLGALVKLHGYLENYFYVLSGRYLESRSTTSSDLVGTWDSLRREIEGYESVAEVSRRQHVTIRRKMRSPEWHLEHDLSRESGRYSRASEDPVGTHWSLILFLGDLYWEIACRMDKDPELRKEFGRHCALYAFDELGRWETTEYRPWSLGRPRIPSISNPRECKLHAVFLYLGVLCRFRARQACIEFFTHPHLGILDIIAGEYGKDSPEYRSRIESTKWLS